MKWIRIRNNTGCFQYEAENVLDKINNQDKPKPETANQRAYGTQLIMWITVTEPDITLWQISCWDFFLLLLFISQMAYSKWYIATI